MMIELPKVVTLVGMVTDASDVQPWKQWLPWRIITMTIILTDDDIVILIMLPINVTDVGMTTDVRLTQASKAHWLKKVTLVGILILVIGQAAYW